MSAGILGKRKMKRNRSNGTQHESETEAKAPKAGLTPARNMYKSNS